MLLYKTCQRCAFMPNAMKSKNIHFVTFTIIFVIGTVSFTARCTCILLFKLYFIFRAIFLMKISIRPSIWLFISIMRDHFGKDGFCIGQRTKTSEQKLQLITFLPILLNENDRLKMQQNKMIFPFRVFVSAAANAIECNNKK